MIAPSCPTATADVGHLGVMNHAPTRVDPVHCWFANTTQTPITPTERWSIRGFEPAQAGEYLAHATFESLAVVAA